MTEKIDFTHILKKSAINDLLSTFASITGISLCLCDKNGKFLHSFVQERDELYKTLVEGTKIIRNILKENLQDIIKNKELDIKIIKGLKFLFKSIIIEKTIVAFVISGPIKEDDVSEEDIKRLTGNFKINYENLLKIVSMRNILSQEETERIRVAIRSFAKVIYEFCQQEFEANRNISRLTSLYNINNNISLCFNIEPVLEMVLNESVKLFEAERAFIMLLNEDKTEMKIISSHGLEREIIEKNIKVGEGIAGKVALSGKSRLIRKKVNKSDNTESKSLMYVPLKAREKVLGVVNISGNRKGKNFTEDDMNLLQTLASNTAISIENAKLYEKLEKKAWELSTLFHIGNAINSSLDRDQVLQKVLDSAIMLLDSRKGSLMLIGTQTDEMRIVAAHGLPPEIISNARVKLGEGISGKVALEGKPRLMKKGVRIEESKSSKELKEIKSAMSAPLTFKNKTQGVVNISDKRTDDNFNEEDMALLMMLANQAATAIENARLHTELQDLFISSIKALANAIDARDPYTRGHSERVTDYSVAMSEKLGLDREEVELIRYAALLHDIGKINIPDHILNKPGKLTDEEFLLMKKHPVFGAQIMEPVKAFQKILPYMFLHHERFSDKKGYPLGINGDAIPIAARIIAVADSFDAMTSDRPYRKSLSLEEAVKELRVNSGTQFDPQIVKVFLEAIKEGKFAHLPPFQDKE